MFYFFIFAATLVLSAVLTFGVRSFAWRWGIVDEPKAGESRKIHSQTTPLLGGLAIFTAFFAVLFFYSDIFLAGNLSWPHLWGFFAGALIIAAGGVLDDKYNLRPQQQIIFPLLAIAALIAGGVEIEKITNPFGGPLDLSSWLWLSPLIIALWLLGLMYTTKLLDGVDGLVSGLGVIGSFIIFLFTLTTRYYQPDIALAALIFSGAAAGFLIFNWHPAKIFLGESGSLLVGYVLGVLSIISGAKIAVALLVMGIPMMDVAWTILRRVASGRNPFRFADRKHLHHRLLSLGLSQPATVAVFYFLSLSFGLAGLWLQSRGKFLALLFLAGIMLLLVAAFWFWDYVKKPRV